jgi:hypothetical protein
VSLSDAAKDQLNTVSTATLTSQLLKRGFRNTFVSGCVPLCPHLPLLGSRSRSATGGSRERC